MSTERQRLEQHRDQVLTDIVELDQQVAGGEIPRDAAQRLRVEYETSAARTLAALDELPTEPATRRRLTVSSITRRAVYVAVAAIALLAVGVLLPSYLAPRPDGGAVSGNVARSQSQSPTESKSPTPEGESSPRRDLSKVSNARMEAVIKRNPNVIGMRLALAQRYLEQGSYDKAAEHYNTALKQQPNNPTVLAQAGQFLLVTEGPGAARKFAAQALRIDPSSADALLLKAEVLVREGDSRQARTILRELTARSGLDQDLRHRADELLGSVRANPGGS